MNARSDQVADVPAVVETDMQPSPRPIFVGRRLEIKRITDALLAGSSVDRVDRPA